MEVFCPWTLQLFEIFFFFIHTPLDHRALQYTVNVVTTSKPKVGVEHQNNVKMEVFRPWTLHFLEIFYFFFIQVWNIMRYDAPSTPMRQLNRKWAWSVKMENFYFFCSYTFGPSCATIHRQRRHHN